MVSPNQKKSNTISSPSSSGPKKIEEKKKDGSKAIVVFGDDFIHKSNNNNGNDESNRSFSTVHSEEEEENNTRLAESNNKNRKDNIFSLQKRRTSSLPNLTRGGSNINHHHHPHHHEFIKNDDDDDDDERRYCHDYDSDTAPSFINNKQEEDDDESRTQETRKIVNNSIMNHDKSYNDNDNETMMMGIMWKLRSGFKSGRRRNRAWEKRLVILKGSILSYYETSSATDFNDDDDIIIVDDDNKVLRGEKLLLIREINQQKQQQHHDQIVLYDPTKKSKDNEQIIKEKNTITTTLTLENEEEEDGSGIDNDRFHEKWVLGISNLDSSSDDDENNHNRHHNSTFHRRLHQVYTRAGHKIQHAAKKTAHSAKKVAHHTAHHAAHMIKNPHHHHHHHFEEEEERSSPPPRGSINLSKQKGMMVTASDAGSSNSYQPTLYSISIKIHSETKWKFCLESQKEQVEWMVALTNAIRISSAKAGREEDDDGYHSDPSEKRGRIRGGVLFLDKLISVEKKVGNHFKHVGGHNIFTPHNKKSNNNKGEAEQGISDLHDPTAEDTRHQSEDDSKIQPSPRSHINHHHHDRHHHHTSRHSYQTILSRFIPSSVQYWRIPEYHLFFLISLMNGIEFYDHYFLTRNSRSANFFHWLQVVFILNLALWLCLESSNTTTTSMQEEEEEEEDQNHAQDNAKETNIPPHTKRMEMIMTNTKDQIKNHLHQPLHLPHHIPYPPHHIPHTLHHIPPLHEQQRKPVAGSTTLQIPTPPSSSPSPSPNNKNNIHHYSCEWCPLSGSTYHVRSPNYHTKKNKIPSPTELYHLVAVDVFESDTRVDDICRRVRLPHVSFQDDGNEVSWKSPDIFVISLALPTSIPKLGPLMMMYGGDGSNSEKKHHRHHEVDDNNKGHIVTCYFVMKEETRRVLRMLTAQQQEEQEQQQQEAGDHNTFHNEQKGEESPIIQNSKKQNRITKKEDNNDPMINAIKLFEKWCTEAPSDPKMQSRFKVIPIGHNLKEMGVPSRISSYSGKPFLIKRVGVTGFLFDHSLGDNIDHCGDDVGKKKRRSVMEFDINFHPFPYLFKQGTAYMKDYYFKKMLISFGFVIEGRTEEELPEVVIGEGAQLCYPDPDFVIQGEDWFEKAEENVEKETK